MRITFPRTWLFLLGWLLFAHAAGAQGQWRFEGVERVVAIGDVHGAYDELVGILGEAGLVDESGRWSGGRAHLVSVGDLLDRGDYGRQVMDLMMRLQSEASAAGGAVHVLVGNHESMNLVGDLRYVSEGDFAQFGAQPRDGFPAGFFERRAALAPDGEYGRWLLSLPLALVVNDTLFVHGGVSERAAGLSLEQLNTEARRDLRTVAEGWHALLAAGVVGDGDSFREVRARAAALAEAPGDAPGDGTLAATARAMNAALEGLPFHPDGVLWYRGNARCHAWAEGPVLRSVLDAVGAERVVIGHTPTRTRRASQRVDGRVWRIDAGMNRAAYGGTPAALLLGDGMPQVLYPGEAAAAVPAEPARRWNPPHGMSDAEIEAFLSTAEITRIEDLGEGVTRPRRLTLEQDGKVMQAVFKTVDTDPGLEAKRRWSRSDDLADRAVYDVAAYQLDRLLGMHMVPVAVQREVAGETGVAQYWLPNSINEGKRREQGLAIEADCNIAPQFNIMNVFDLLIFNVDRNLGNVLYDEDGRVWLIDHSRAFGTQRGIPSMLRDAEVTVTPELSAMLQQVTTERLEPLRPYLNERQLKALVSRAQALQKLR